jgi:hypothetical protein
VAPSKDMSRHPPALQNHMLSLSIATPLQPEPPALVTASLHIFGANCQSHFDFSAVSEVFWCSVHDSAVFTYLTPWLTIQ